MGHRRVTSQGDISPVANVFRGLVQAMSPSFSAQWKDAE